MNWIPAEHSEVMDIYGRGPFILRYNIFRNFRSTGNVQFSDGLQDLQAYGNLFTGDGGAGYTDDLSRVFDSFGGESVSGVKLYDNTFVDISPGGTLFQYGSFANSEVRNNIFYNVKNRNGQLSVGTQGVTLSHNWYYDVGTAPTESNRQIGTGDPFVNRAGKDFRLKAATDAGMNLGSPYNVDRDGKTRGADGVWDRGAYEYGDTGGGGGGPTPIPGQCGAAAKTYSATETFPSGAYCATGTPSPTTPTNPASGNSTTWQCLGSNNESNASCTATRQSGTPTNNPPTVSIISPQSGANFPTAPATVRVDVSASDSQGITRVDFFRNGVFQGTANQTASPFNYGFGLTAGSYILTAVAHNVEGASASAFITVTVGLVGSSCTSPSGATLANTASPCPVLSVSSNSIDSGNPVAITSCSAKFSTIYPQ